LKIRNATADDISSIMALERAAASAAHWSESQYRGLFSPGVRTIRNLVLVAEKTADETSDAAVPLLGFLVARQISPEWELENIVVAGSVRRNKIGKQLLKALLVAARQTNSQTVFLEVRESNGPARAFYEKAGFQEVGRRKSYYKDPQEDAILYRYGLC
jgi:ribosomal-protein-alanine N-acetyltransferase